MERFAEQFLTDTLQLKNKDAVRKLASCSKTICLKPKEILYCQGYKPDYLAFLLDGIMRSFVIGEKGVDSTEAFDFRPGSPVVPSIPINAPASVNVEASVKSTLLLFPIEDIWYLMNTDVSVSQLYNVLLCQYMQQYVAFTRVMMHCTTEQKYQWFLQTYGALNGKVSSKEIASFLNMSPVTLSKIRKTMQK